MGGFAPDYAMFYEHKGYRQLIGCVACAYGIRLYYFRSQENDSYIIVLKSECEYWPLFYTYYVHEGKVVRIGKWIVHEPMID